MTHKKMSFLTVVIDPVHRRTGEIFLGGQSWNYPKILRHKNMVDD